MLRKQKFSAIKTFVLCGETKWVLVINSLKQRIKHKDNQADGLSKLHRVTCDEHVCSFVLETKNCRISVNTVCYD